MASLLYPGAAIPAGWKTAAIEILNTMLAAWGAERINVAAEIRQAPFTVTSGTSAYTVGNGGNINISRPAEITRASWSVNDIEYPPLRKLSDHEFQLVDKTTQGTPAAYHYRNQAPLGTVTLVPVPASADQLVLYTPVRFTAYTAGTDVVNLPDGYDDAIRPALALRLVAQLQHLGAKMDPEIMAQIKEEARIAKLRIQRLNLHYPAYFPDFPVPDKNVISETDFISGSFLGYH